MFATQDSTQADEISRKVICQNSGKASSVVQVRYTDGILSLSAFDRCTVRVLQMKFGCGRMSFDQKIGTTIYTVLQYVDYGTTSRSIDSTDTYSEYGTGRESVVLYGSTAVQY